MSLSEEIAKAAAKAKIEAEKAVEVTKQTAGPFIAALGEAAGEARKNAGPVAKEISDSAKKKLQQLKGAIAGETPATAETEELPEVVSAPNPVVREHKTAQEATRAKRAKYAAASAETETPEVKKPARKRTTRTPKQ